MLFCDLVSTYSLVLGIFILAKENSILVELELVVFFD